MRNGAAQKALMLSTFVGMMRQLNQPTWTTSLRQLHQPQPSTSPKRS
jgi:hypothetical protein